MRRDQIEHAKVTPEHENITLQHLRLCARLVLDTSCEELVHSLFSLTWPLPSHPTGDTRSSDIISRAAPTMRRQMALLCAANKSPLAQ